MESTSIAVMEEIKPDAQRSRSSTQVGAPLKARLRWSKLREQFAFQGGLNLKEQRGRSNTLEPRKQVSEEVKEEKKKKEAALHSMLGMPTTEGGQPDFDDKDPLVFDQDIQGGDGDFSKGWTVIMNNILNPSAPKHGTFKRFQKERIEYKVKKIQEQNAKKIDLLASVDGGGVYGSLRNQSPTLPPPPPVPEEAKKQDSSPKQVVKTPVSPIKEREEVKMKTKLQDLINAKQVLSRLEQDFNNEWKLMSKIDRKFKLKNSQSFETMLPRFGQPRNAEQSPTLTAQQEQTFTRVLSRQKRQNEVRKFQLPKIDRNNRSMSPKLIKSKNSGRKSPVTVREIKLMKHHSSNVILPALNKRFGQVILPRSSDRSLETSVSQSGDNSLKMRFLDRISKKAVTSSQME